MPQKALPGCSILSKDVKCSSGSNPQNSTLHCRSWHPRSLSCWCKLRVTLNVPPSNNQSEAHQHMSLAGTAAAPQLRATALPGCPRGSLRTLCCGPPPRSGSAGASALQSPPLPLPCIAWHKTCVTAKALFPGLGIESQADISYGDGGVHRFAATTAPPIYVYGA